MFLKQKMKIGIISDTHDNIPNIEKAINWMNQNGIEKLLHCGDISTKETMEFISRKFPQEIFAVFGNMDVGKNDNWKFSNVKIFPETGSLELGVKKIAIVHRPELAKDLAESKKFDLVFYGHTHKPWLEKINDCQMINPGELAGQFYKPCFAVYDMETDKLELKILETL